MPYSHKVNLMGLRLSDSEKKALDEMWGACSSGAMHALAGTLGRDIRLARQRVEQMVLNDVPAFVNKDNPDSVMVYLKLSGVVKGVAALCAAPSNLLALADMLLHKEIGTFKILDDNNFSVVNELLNMMTGYYVDALVARISGRIVTHEAICSVNAYKAIDDFGLGETFNEIKILLFENKFEIPDVQVSGKTFLILPEKVLKKFI